MQISEQIKAIDLAEVVRNSGVELTQKGSRLSGLCPFHADKNPSFFILSNRFYCFGCNASGDAADFVMRLYSLDFREALKFLGITGGSFHYSRLEVAKRREALRAKKLRVQRERELIATLGLLIRTTYRVISDFKTINDFERSGDILDPLSWWEFCHNILACGSRAEKDEVLDALAEFPTLRRHYLWSADFNYREWLRGFLKNEANHEEEFSRIAITFNYG